MVTRSEFIKAVKEFKRFHHGKLKDLLNKTTHPEATKDFWANPIIHAYLARPSVTFIDKHPHLMDSRTKEEHDDSDYYELKIYQYLPNVIVYRDSEINTPKFYTEGAYASQLFHQLLKNFAHGSTDIEMMGIADIYHIASKVTKRFINSEVKVHPRFVLSANWKDTHATALLTVLDPFTGRALLTLFMNSYQNEEHYKRYKTSFLIRQTETTLIPSRSSFQQHEIDLLKQYVLKTFKLDIDDANLSSKPATLLKNLEEKAIFCLNYTSSNFYSAEYLALENSPEIETSYSFNKDSPATQKEFTITHMPKIPFIDVSHELQLADDDKNCAFYSLNFIQAITNLLKQSEQAERIFALANSVKSDPRATEILIHIFREELKTYLPQYYDACTKAPKPRASIEAFHLNQRWEIGARSVSMLHSASVSESGLFAPKEEPVEETKDDSISLKK